MTPQEAPAAALRVPWPMAEYPDSVYVDAADDVLTHLHEQGFDVVPTGGGAVVKLPTEEEARLLRFQRIAVERFRDELAQGVGTLLLHRHRQDYQPFVGLDDVLRLIEEVDPALALPEDVL